VSAPAVGTSLIAFIIVYFIVFGAGVYYLLRLMRRPPTCSTPIMSWMPDRSGRQGSHPVRPRIIRLEDIMAIDLPFVWAGIIAFAVLAYVVLDGFDLGIGIVFPFFRNRRDRDVMTNSIAPVWDGNETWLVLGGGGLMAVFPLAYATSFRRSTCRSS
jgi:hypothetical protein